MSFRRFSLPAAIVVFVAWSVCPAAAQEAEENRVRAHLVADTPEVRPGSTVRIGIRFEIENGWHIYWRNPGGAGLATAIDFELPEPIGPSVPPMYLHT